MNKVGIIVLAAGKGKRMGGRKPKLLRLIDGTPAIVRTLKTIEKLNLDIVVVCSSNMPDIKKIIEKFKFKVKFVVQGQKQGTAAAAEDGLKVLNKVENVLVIYGDDSSLYSLKLLKNFISFHLKNKNQSTFLTSHLINPVTIGALRKDKKGRVVGIIGKQEISQNKKKQIYEVACGAFLFKRDWLVKHISSIKKNPKSGEYSLPALIGIGVKTKNYVVTYPIENTNEWHSMNTQKELVATRVKFKKLKYDRKTR